MKIKESNRFFAVIIGLIIVLVGVLLFRSIYISNNNNNKNYLNKLTTVNEEELDTYILENSKVYLYINNMKSNINKRFEKDLNKYKFNSKVIHYDTSMGSSDFLDKFNEKYNTKIEDLPAFIYIKDTEVLTIFSKDDLTINNVSSLVEE